MSKSTLNSLHSADGSFLGFFFQIERVLSWLSMCDSAGYIGVEVDDDIVVKLHEGCTIESIYEQAKNTQLKNKTPFSDKSEDLWKTLSIWIKLVEHEGIDPEKSIFSAITNKRIPNAKLLNRLSSASKNDYENLVETCRALKLDAKNLRKGLAKYGDIVTNCDETTLCSIIDKVTILDADYIHDKNFKLNLKKDLRMSDDLPFGFIYDGLFGYVSDLLISLWKEKKQGWISVEAFLNRYTALIAEFKKKKFIEKATSSLPVTDEDIRKNRNQIYVEQLKEIGCDENEILESIEHFLRASSEKSRYAKDGDVSQEMFQIYYHDLTENWKSVSRPRFRACKSKVPLHEDIGYDVFYETIRYKGRLNNQEPEQAYTNKGAYHFLSNDSQLGWHPQWEIKFKK